MGSVLPALGRKSVEKIQVSLKSDKNNGYLLENLCTFSIIPRFILLKMRNVSEKTCRETQNTHFVFSNLFSPENHAVCEIIWKNMQQLDWPHVTV
jgi:hypothetical protein